MNLNCDVPAPTVGKDLPRNEFHPEITQKKVWEGCQQLT